MKDLIYKLKADDTNTIIQIEYKGEVVFSFDDSANQEYPEDLTWDRMIGGIFYKGVELGKRIAKDEQS